jgi:hypothetical protein
MSLESDLLQSERVTDDAPPPAFEEPPPAPVTPEDEDAAIDAQAIHLPDGDAMVPLSAVTGARTALKAAKAELATLKPSAERATQLEGQITQLQGKIAQMEPVVSAYHAYIASQQQAQQPPPQPSAEDTADLQEIARDIDLYKTDGTPDLDKARRLLDREQRVAQRVAQQAIAPIQQQDVQRQSAYTLQRALVSALPNGQKASEAAIRYVWSQLDPALTATADGAKQAYIAALGYTQAMQQQAAPAAAPPAQGTRNAQGQFVAGQAAATPPPMHTERAGGASGPLTATLSPEEQRFLKQTGMSEKEYLESAANMPGGRR